MVRQHCFCRCCCLHSSSQQLAGTFVSQVMHISGNSSPGQECQHVFRGSQPVSLWNMSGSIVVDHAVYVAKCSRSQVRMLVMKKLNACRCQPVRYE
jgi:hypothetical protein